MIEAKEDKAEAQAMNAEQAADFAALQASANEEEQTAIPGEPEKVEVNLAKEIATFLVVIATVTKPMFPSLSLIYTEESAESVGLCAAAVFKKRNLFQGGFLGSYQEEIAAAYVIGPLLFASVKGIQGDIETRKKKTLELAKPENSHAIAPPPPAAGTVQNESAKTVTFGAVA